MKLQVKNNVYWVGKTDWELRKFHGNEYSTTRGSTYNSYLVKERKTALIDTVWAPFARQYVENLAAEIDLDSIDFVVANHAEVDHSGALPELLRRIPGKPVYCTANGLKSLKGHYHQDWDFRPVKTGDRLSLGDKELVFVEAPMLHWPDSMMCYLTGDAVLFSNDAFGQHYASSSHFNDQVDQEELFQECLKYYANILTPFSKLVTKKIQEFLALGLPLDMICTSHGVIWRKNPVQIVEKYLAWAADYRENRVVVVYDTMWEGTRVMAEQLAEGLRAAGGGTEVVLRNAAKTDKNDIVADIFRSKALVLGSPTINKGILTSIAGLLEEVQGLGFRGKKAAVFGSFGWSGEANGVLARRLKDAGFEVVDEGLKASWQPDEQSRARCREYGRELAAKLG